VVQAQDDQIQDEQQLEDTGYYLEDIYRQTGEMKGLGGIGGHQGRRSEGQRWQDPALTAEQRADSAHYQASVQASLSSKPAGRAQENSEHFEDQTPKLRPRMETMQPQHSRQEHFGKFTNNKEEPALRSNTLYNNQGQNNAVSENCRDSLETNTYNTRFTQNTPELMSSSNDGATHSMNPRMQQLGQQRGRNNAAYSNNTTSMIEQERARLQKPEQSQGSNYTKRRALQPLIQSNSPSTSNP